MKMILWVAFAWCITVFTAYAQSNSNKQNHKEMKPLVAYFSATGTTHSRRHHPCQSCQSLSHFDPEMVNFLIGFVK